MRISASLLYTFWYSVALGLRVKETILKDLISQTKNMELWIIFVKSFVIGFFEKINEIWKYIKFRSPIQNCSTLNGKNVMDFNPFHVRGGYFCFECTGVSTWIEYKTIGERWIGSPLQTYKHFNAMPLEELISVSYTKSIIIKPLQNLHVCNLHFNGKVQKMQSERINKNLKRKTEKLI